MNLLTIVLSFAAILYSPVQADPCVRCDLTGYYTRAKGYQCIPLSTTEAICTCPGGTRWERNMPCRLCGPTTQPQAVCNPGNPKLLTCLETDDFATGYACLCQDAFGNAYATQDYDCNFVPTLTSTATTTTTTVTGGPGAGCNNGGILVNSLCNCPSGYSGAVCGVHDPAALCDRVHCLNNGVCATRNPNGPFEAVCLCRYGTWGDYCELTGTLTACSANFCSNNGACVENVVGTTRHAYCRCQPGYSGVKCETRYFECRSAGLFVDLPMFNQGKYFQCTLIGATYKLEQRSCPKGLRFNANVNQCTY